MWCMLVIQGFALWPFPGELHRSTTLTVWAKEIKPGRELERKRQRERESGVGVGVDGFGGKVEWRGTVKFVNKKGDDYYTKVIKQVVLSQ